MWGSNPRMLEPQSSVLTTSPIPPYKKYFNKFLFLLQVYIIINLKKEDGFMIMLSVFTPIFEFFKPITNFFKELWYDINSFLLRYMPQDVLNILMFGIVVAIILIVVLAIVNKN